jgi:RimJ/RimL family protein N-acetyltransferase
VAAWLDGSKLLVRPVDPQTDADVRFLFDLANEPTVRQAGFHSDPIPWDTHVDWVKHHSESAESLLLCGEHHELGRCASIRFHQRAERDWEIGIAVTPAARGKGIAREAALRGIRLLRQTHPNHRIIAIVKPENEVSLALFRSLGFQQATPPKVEAGITFALM